MVVKNQASQKFKDDLFQKNAYEQIVPFANADANLLNQLSYQISDPNNMSSFFFFFEH